MDKELIVSCFAGTDLKVFAPSEQDFHLAKASFENLKEYLPKDIDLEKNSDLLAVTFNGCVINRGNKNGDIMATDAALAMLPSFKYKFINLNHLRSSIVGFINGYGFSEYGTSKPLSEEEIRETKDPFNIVISGYVWRFANCKFASFLEECSDPESDNYGKVCTSWEVGFKKWGIVKGGRNFAECEEIVDPEEFKKYTSYVKAFGGKGVDEDGRPVYRIIKITEEGEPPLGMGFGFTENPAADVKGVLVAEEKKEEINVSLKKTNNLEKKSSQIKKENVKNNIINAMKKNIRFNSIDEINDEVLQEASADSVKDFISEKLKEGSSNWEKEKTEKDNQIEAANKKIEEAEKSVELVKAENETLKKALEDIKKELEEIKAKQLEKEANEKFQVRMAALDNEYNLEDEERRLIASDIKELDEENFASWLEKFKVFAKSKKKKVETKAEEIKAEGTKEEILEKAEAEKSKLPNSTSESSEVDSITQRMKKAFSIDGFKISTGK